MSKAPYLIVNHHDGRHSKFRLSWFPSEDGHIGGSLGELSFTEADLKTVDAEDVDSVVAYLTVSKMGVPKDLGGFYWESDKQAQAALRVVRAAIAAAVDRPMPDWATKALEAGWKAPKGWKP